MASAAETEVGFSCGLSLPPRINRTYKTTVGGGFYKDALVSAWQNEAVILLRQAGATRLKESRSLSVHLTLYCADVRDIDSGVKMTLDALAAACSVDDRYVYRLILEKVPTKKRRDHRMVVEVRVL